MTKKIEYRVDAYACVPYAAFIHADSLEEAWEIAEKKAKEFSYDALNSDFTMSCDDYGIEVESVAPSFHQMPAEEEEEEEEEAPPKVIDIPKRDFIPGWDD